MSKRVETEIAYPLLRIHLIVFAVLLLLGVAVALLYPSIRLSLGRRAMEQGDAEQAIQYLSQAEDDAESQEMLNAAREQHAESLMAEERFAEALAVLEEIPGIASDDARIVACRYGMALAAEQRGAYSEARDGYAAILGYADSAERIAACEIAIAQTAWADGDAEIALALIGKYPQAPAMQTLYREIRLTEAQTLLASDTPENGLKLLLQLWNENESLTDEVIAAERICYPYLYADRDDTFILEQLHSLNAAQAARKNRFEQMRQELPCGVLAVGSAHTVALRADGTVLATGDNAYGQCDVQAWRDIVAVAAGAYHTVGLKADGTVVATGDNSRGQCDCAGTADVAEITAHAMDTVLRTADGTFLCFGAHDYTAAAASWTDIVRISPAAYGLIGLAADGTAMATEASLLTPAFRGLTEIAAAGNYAVGITAEGLLVTSAPIEADFVDVLRVDAAATGFFVLTADGTVCAALWTDGDYSPLFARSDIEAIAFSGTHAIALLSDGSYLACGENGCGQCDVESWRR